MKMPPLAPDHPPRRNPQRRVITLFVLLLGLALLSMSFNFNKMAKSGLKGAQEAGATEAAAQAGAKVLVKACKSAKLKKCKLLGKSFKLYVKKEESNATKKAQRFMEINGSKQKEKVMQLLDQGAQMAGSYAKPVQEYSAFLQQNVQELAAEGAAQADALKQQGQDALGEQAETLKKEGKELIESDEENPKSEKKGTKDKKKKKKKGMFKMFR